KKVVVARARRQQRDGGVGTVGAAGQRALQLLEEGRKPHRLAGSKDVAGDIGVHHAVGDRVTDPGWGLRVRVDNAPAAVRATSKITGEELDEAPGRPDPVTGPQKGWIAEHELMRNGARCQQLLRPIEVGKNALEQ